MTPFFGETVGKEALGGAVGLMGYRLDMAIKQLVEMSMLDARDEAGTTGQRYSIHPLIRTFATDRLREKAAWEGEARERWVAWYLTFLQLYDSKTEDWPVFAVLDEERENIMAVIEWTRAHRANASFSLIQRFWFFLYVRGYLQQCEVYLRHALESASSEGNTPARLMFASQLGWLFTQQQGSTQEAVQWLRRVECEILALGQSALLEEFSVLNHLSQAYLALDDLDMVEAYQRRFLELAQAAGNRWHAFEARYYLAWVEFLRGQIEQAH